MGFSYFYIVAGYSKPSMNNEEVFTAPHSGQK